ncbi:hypothetical protein MRB53_040487 [Persea americana]|nr:hypothetical protein MRB53_040487 [Persea americana]
MPSARWGLLRYSGFTSHLNKVSRMFTRSTTRSSTPSTETPLQAPKRRRILTAKRVEGFSRITLLSAATLLGVHVFAEYFYECNGAYGISMLPTFASFGDWPVTSKYHRRGRDVKVGDVVSFKHPVRQREHAIKRIIGLEGDFVLMNTPGRSDAMIQSNQHSATPSLGRGSSLTSEQLASSLLRDSSQDLCSENDRKSMIRVAFLNLLQVATDTAVNKRFEAPSVRCFIKSRVVLDIALLPTGLLIARDLDVGVGPSPEA